MIAGASLRRATAALALAALVIPASGPLAGTQAWAPRARAAEPAVILPAPTVVWHGSRAGRVVALTFDDGWSPANLRRIYRILVRERVPATFFVTGIYVQRAPALWRAISAAGFPLANHSYLHRDTRGLTPRLAALDMTLTREVVERATGRPMLPYYRPPYGARNPATDRRAAAAGFPYVVLWDTTGADTIGHATVSSVVRGATAGRPGSIVLLHAGPGVTPRALPAIIARYRDRGFRFVTIPELLGARPDGTVPAVPDLPDVPPGPAGPGPRSLDRLGEVAAPGQKIEPAPAAASGDVVAPVDVRPPFLARPAANPVPSPAALPAREAAWARRSGTPAMIGVFTAALLGVLLAVAAAAGRRRRPEDDGTK